MSPLKIATLVLLAIGGLNWGLVGLFGFDLVAAIFGAGSVLSRLVYVVVALSALHQLAGLRQRRDAGIAHLELHRVPLVAELRTEGVARLRRRRRQRVHEPLVDASMSIASAKADVSMYGCASWSSRAPVKPTARAKGASTNASALSKSVSS